MDEVATGETLTSFAMLFQRIQIIFKKFVVRTFVCFACCGCRCCAWPFPTRCHRDRSSSPMLTRHTNVIHFCYLFTKIVVIRLSGSKQKIKYVISSSDFGVCLRFSWLVVLVSVNGIEASQLESVLRFCGWLMSTVRNDVHGIDETRVTVSFYARGFRKVFPIVDPCLTA